MNIALRRKQTPIGFYEELVEQGIAIQQGFNRVTPFGDARDEKLSADRYLADAVANAETTYGRLTELEKRLATGQHHWLDLFMSGVRHGVTATRTDQGCNLDPITQNLWMVARIPESEFINVVFEAQQYGTTPLELVALVVWQAVQQVPDAFGVIDDRDAHGRQIAKLDELADAIHPAAWAAGSVAPHYQGNGLYVFTFVWKHADSEVAYRPDRDAAREFVRLMA